MLKPEIIFVINPISGTIKKKSINKLLETNKLLKNTSWEIRYTERPGHASQITKEAINQNIPIVIAVGGDGTVNEIAKSLIDTQVSVGIIPFGSGNGLARHLNIPLDAKKAIDKIAAKKTKLIDACFVNKQAFFCTSGVGFDALISHKFAIKKGRGITNYIKSIALEYFQFKTTKYKIIIDEKVFEENAHIITLANANQYGNNIYISPEADISDGLIDLCIIKKHPFWQLPIIVIRLLTKSIYNSPYFNLKKGKHIKIENNASRFVHFDGEPHLINGNLDFTIKKQALKVII